MQDIQEPYGELLVAVDHNQLRTMASETVDLTDWSHLGSTSWAPGALYKSVQLSHSRDSIYNLATFSMLGNHLAYAATQGS